MKKYQAVNYPVRPEKGLLIMLWNMAHGDTLMCTADRFGIAPSTVRQSIVSIFANNQR